LDLVVRLRSDRVGRVRSGGRSPKDSAIDDLRGKAMPFKYEIFPDKRLVLTQGYGTITDD
jgi:hypothetical protein